MKHDLVDNRRAHSRTRVWSAGTFELGNGPRIIGASERAAFQGDEFVVIRHAGVMTPEGNTVFSRLKRFRRDISGKIASGGGLGEVYLIAMRSAEGKRARVGGDPVEL